MMTGNQIVNLEMVFSLNLSVSEKSIMEWALSPNIYTRGLFCSHGLNEIIRAWKSD